MTLLYELGEGASEEAMKPGTGALAQLAQGEQFRRSVVCDRLQSHALRLIRICQRGNRGKT